MDKEITVKIPKEDAYRVRDLVKWSKTSYKIFFGEEIIRNASDIRINGVRVNGDSISIFNNRIQIGFTDLKDCKDSKTKEIIGKTVDFTETTAELYNSDNFHKIAFTLGNRRWIIDFY